MVIRSRFMRTVLISAVAFSLLTPAINALASTHVSDTDYQPIDLTVSLDSRSVPNTKLALVSLSDVSSDGGTLFSNHCVEGAGIATGEHKACFVLHKIGSDFTGSAKFSYTVSVNGKSFEMTNPVAFDVDKNGIISTGLHTGNHLISSSQTDSLYCEFVNHGDTTNSLQLNCLYK